MAQETSIVLNGALPPRPFRWAEEVRATLGLAIPLVITQVAQIAIQATDVLMLGRLGETALAAGSLGATLGTFLWLFGLGIVTAVAPLASQAYGARSPRVLRVIVRQGMWVSVAIGVPFSLILTQGTAILVFLGQDPTLAMDAGVYLTSFLWGITPALLLVVLRCFLSAVGHPTPVVWVMGIGVALNALLDYALIFGKLGAPRWELFGAGLASSIVNLFMFLGLLFIAVQSRRFRRYHILGRLWRPDWGRFIEILRLGIPIGATIILEVGMFAAANLLMGLIGKTELAAHAIALQLAAVTFMVPLGVGHAATVRIGHHHGAGRSGDVPRAGVVALLLSLGFMSLTAIAFWTVPEFLMQLFLGFDVPVTDAVVVFGASFLFVAAIFQLVDGAQVVGVSCLRGISDTKIPMFFAAFGYWGVGFSSCYLLAFQAGLGGVGVWIGLALGLAASAVLMVSRFYILTRPGRL